MKAATYKRYGSADVLDLVEVERPEIGDDDVLVKVLASSVTTADWRIRASAFPAYAWLPGRLMFGLFSPRNRILGSDFAGTVVATGRNVTRFTEGDAVFGFAGKGAHAEYLSIAANGVIVPMPANLSPDEAAAVPFGALSALVFLRDYAKVQPGQRVLVNGASGGVGVFAVQLAKHFGAEVTGVASAANQDLVRSLGADHVIDYAKEDFTVGGKTYDVVFDTVGTTSFARVRKALTPNGIYVPIEFGLREIGQSIVTSMTGGRKVAVGVSGDTREDLATIADLLEQGTIRQVIDDRYPLARIAEAHRRVESRHKRGSVIVTIASPSAVVDIAAA